MLIDDVPMAETAYRLSIFHEGLPYYDAGNFFTVPSADNVMRRDAHEDVRSIVSAAMDAGIGDASAGLVVACIRPLRTHHSSPDPVNGAILLP